MRIRKTITCVIALGLAVSFNLISSNELRRAYLKKDHQTLSIRKANDPDISAINQVLRLSKGYWGYDEIFMDAFMEQFALNEKYLQDNTVYVMQKNEDIVGFFSFVFHEDDSLELDLFFISPEYIGKGYGRQLWKSCCSIACELGVEAFILWADPNAEGFYTKMGCKKIGVKKSSFLPNRYPPIMQFTLTQKDRK